MLSPLLIDGILVGIGIELAGLTAVLFRTGRRRWIPPMVAFLLSGAALMLALRFALSGASPMLIQASMAVSGLMHILTLWLVVRALD